MPEIIERAGYSAGTVTAAAGSDTLNFSGTALLSNAYKFDVIQIGSALGLIKEVVNNTQAKVFLPWPAAATAAPYVICNIGALKSDVETLARLQGLIAQMAEFLSAEDIADVLRVTSQSLTVGQQTIARVNIGTGSTKNLPGATIWDKIVHAANNGYRWADVEDYDGQTISVTSRLDMPSEFQLRAGGALFEKAFSGTMFRLGDKAQIHGGKYDPKPGSFTGDMFEVVGGNHQIVRDIIMRDKAEGYGLNFKASDEGGVDGAGTGLLVDGGLWIGATSGSSKAHVFKGPNIAPATSGYARFANINCGGTQAFDFRAARGWQITMPVIGGANPLQFATNTFNAQIRGGRVALIGVQNVFGTNHVFDNVELGGTFTYVLAANTAGCVFNLMGFEDIIDNSGKINRFSGCKEHSFTPTFTVSAGGPVNFGAGGSVAGRARRVDDRLLLIIEIVWGTSPTPGTGSYTVGLPSTYSLSSVLSRRAKIGGDAYYIRGASERQGMHCDIAAGASSFLLYLDDEAANFFNAAWPFPIAAGDRQVIEFEYEVGSP